MATIARSTDDHAPAIEEDFAAWAFHQAMLLRAGRWRDLDAMEIAKELDTFGRKEYRTLESFLVPAMQHMLKWDSQPARRTVSWVSSVNSSRSQIQKLLTDSPTLKARREEAISEAYPEAVRDASSDTELAVKAFPATCPYGWEEIMTRPFDWPAPGPDDPA